MSGTKTHYTMRELAGVPGMTATESGNIRMAKRENWQGQKRKGTKATEYPLTCLPEATRNHLIGAILLTPTAEQSMTKSVSPAELIERPAAPAPAVQKLAELKTWQQKIMDARLCFIRLIERAENEIGVNKAVTHLAEKSKAGELPEEMQRLVSVANARAGNSGGRALSRSSLLRWWREYKAAGGNYAVLAPAQVEKQEIPAWAPLFLKLYQVPQKPSVDMVVRDMAALLPVGIAVPSTAAVRRWVKKYSRLEIQKGRKSGSELRGQRLYRERDFSHMAPGDCFVFDGHSFKALVAHPHHGRPFKPEICCGIDVATRYAVGFSVGLAESTQTVADAIRASMTINEHSPVACIPAAIYADNGGGNLAKVNSDEIAGLYARLGITFMTGIAGNPQARGVIERLNSSLWIPAAKRLPTFVGKDMDTLEARKVYLTLQKEVRASQKSGLPVNSPLLLSWPDFIDFCADEINAYNHRPHSSLDRIRDPRTNLMRYMTPAECWASFVAKGWQPVLPEEKEMDTLFRPHEMRPCSRGKITLWGNVYSDASLEHYHGTKLMVGYDIHDASRVWVREPQGRLIVVAKRDAHKSGFISITANEKNIENRYKNRMRTLGRKVEEVELERRGAPLQLVANVASAEVIAQTNAIIAKVEAKKKLVNSPIERLQEIRERIKNGGEVSAYEQQWVSDYDAFFATGKKSQLLRNDEFCTGPAIAAKAEHQ